MSFNYNTCSNIDYNISEMKSKINYELSNMIYKCCPLLEGQNIYTLFESYFEKVRETNKDMRYKAEKQIDDYEAEIRFLDGIISNLKEKLENKQN